MALKFIFVFLFYKNDSITSREGDYNLSYFIINFTTINICFLKKFTEKLYLYQDIFLFFIAVQSLIRLISLFTYYLNVIVIIINCSI